MLWNDVSTQHNGCRDVEYCGGEPEQADRGSGRGAGTSLKFSGA